MIYLTTPFAVIYIEIKLFKLLLLDHRFPGHFHLSSEHSFTKCGLS